MRCNRCGNDNPSENRFCGMCGATLLPPAAPTVPETQTQRAASAGPGIPSVATAPPRPAQETPRPAAPAPKHEPSISGPSFLGLGDTPPRKRASLSIDPHHGGHSGNLDYLLEDDQEPKRGGAGKGIFIIVVLVIVVGFGYLRFRNNGFKWSANDNKPAPAQQPAADSSTNPPATSSPSITPEPAPAQTQSPQATAPAHAETNSALPAAAPENTAKTGDSKPPAPDNSAENADGNGDAPAPPPAKTAKAEPKPPKPAPAKPSPVAKPARASDPVAEAQKYLYGKGAPQNCDRGLQLLKPEANKANPKAMIEMGALYSAGLCTPRDLPTAYRWFAQALRKDPDNLSVQTDLQKLWGEMTQPERQLAIKLSQ
jgi:hypothetical protein